MNPFEVAGKEALKAKRATFKAVIKSLEKSGYNSAIGHSSGGGWGSSVTWNPGSALLSTNATETNFGTKNLEPLRNVLSTRMADPTEILDEAINTGRLAGKKISSSQRRQLASALALHRMEKNAVEVGDPNAILYGYAREPMPQWRHRNESEAEQIAANKFQDIAWDLARKSPAARKQISPSRYGVYNKNFSVLDKLIPALNESGDADLAKKAALLPMLGRIGTQNRYTYDMTRPTMYSPISSAKSRVGAMAESTGARNMQYTSRELDLINKASSMVNDPTTLEIVKGLARGWTGTPEELVQIASIV